MAPPPDALPFSEACDENKDAILAVLRDVLDGVREVLEIGSGTGQHAVHFGAHLPHIVWHTSDLPAHHPGIGAWLARAALPNVREPVSLDVTRRPWPLSAVDAVFSANTAHIMDWAAVQAMFDGVSGLLPSGGVFVLYGPFSRGGRHTSPSNERFDAWLRARDPASGVRDIDALADLARRGGLALERDIEMPVNNRSLVWRRA